MKELTQELVRSLFDYRDGFLYWKVQKAYCIQISDKAGTLDNKYYRIKINDKLYRTHRLIFLYHYGFLPKYIDHIDGDKRNNKIENLREITNSQNCMNRKSQKNSTSKYKGVCWSKRNQKWMAYIFYNNKQNYLGYFDNEKAAAFIYNVYARGYFKEFANLNNLGDK